MIVSSFWYITDKPVGGTTTQCIDAEEAQMAISEPLKKKLREAWVDNDEVTRAINDEEISLLISEMRKSLKTENADFVYAVSRFLSAEMIGPYVRRAKALIAKRDSLELLIKET
ncbi:MAG TPA: hypothetical protein PK109_00885 [Candidatus Paceibacterota bacterium]|nr:hypothetical protein [Candidatus Paceibacterota bacterium]